MLGSARSMCSSLADTASTSSSCHRVRLRSGTVVTLAGSAVAAAVMTKQKKKEKAGCICPACSTESSSLSPHHHHPLPTAAAAAARCCCCMHQPTKAQGSSLTAPDAQAETSASSS